jgi:hypothetical protein
MMMRLRRTLPLGVLLATAACTNFHPVAHDGGRWEQARLASQYQGSVAAPVTTSGAEPASAASAAVWSRAPDPWSSPPPAAGALEPKPLPPLEGGGAAGPVRDTPVVASELASDPAMPVEAAEPLRAGPPPSSGPVAEPKPEPVRVAAVEPTAPVESPGAASPAVAVDEALTPPALSGVGFLWPVPEIGAAEVMTTSAADGGLVIEAAAGAPFVAAENGVVVFAADAMESFGNMVVVRHDGDYTTTYAHAQELAVSVGDVVRRGQRLGLVGQTGGAVAPGLYFEMRVGNRVVDPRAYLVGAPRLASG